MKKRKYILLIALSVVMLTGCKTSETKSELSDYYLSMTNSSRINENEISVENHTYDFEKDKMDTEKYKMSLTAKYSLAVYDNKGKAVLYSAKDTNGNDEVYMPQSMGIIANKNDILFAVQSEIDGNDVFRYNIKDNKVDKVKELETLEKVFYLDEESKNVYRFNGKIGKINLETGKEEWLDSNFKESYFNNYMLLKK